MDNTAVVVSFMSGEDYWESLKKQPTLESWMSELEGSILCDCDHGCRSWVVNNGPKALMVIRALLAGKSKEELDKIVQKHTDEVGKEVWDEREKVSLNSSDT